MLYKTQGVVFRFTKYSESSIIVTIYTDRFGLQSYMVNGVRKVSAQTKMALYQPLTLLDMVVYHREQANLNRIKEIKCLRPYQHLPYHPEKAAISFFMLELMNKTIREQSPSAGLCAFLISACEALDAMEVGYENFHLYFLIRLSDFLGIRPLQWEEVDGLGLLATENRELFQQLLDGKAAPFSREQRNLFVDKLLAFYRHHIDAMGELRSLPVLRQLLS